LAPSDRPGTKRAIESPSHHSRAYRPHRPGSGRFDTISAILLDLLATAALLALRNILFRRFTHYTLTYRFLKTTALVAVMSPISYFFGHQGVLTTILLAALPLIHLYPILLPRKGINGLTAEPREKYHALRGWPPPGRYLLGILTSQGRMTLYRQPATP